MKGCCRFPLSAKAASSPADARAHNRPLSQPLRRPKTTFSDAGPPLLKAASVRWIQCMDNKKKLRKRDRGPPLLSCCTRQVRQFTTNLAGETCPWAAFSEENSADCSVSPHLLRMNERGRKETKHFSRKVLSGDQHGRFISSKDAAMHVRRLLLSVLWHFWKMQRLAATGTFQEKLPRLETFHRDADMDSILPPPVYAIKLYAKLQTLQAAPDSAPHDLRCCTKGAHV